jgi:hypothetical protein
LKTRREFWNNGCEIKYSDCVGHVGELGAGGPHGQHHGLHEEKGGSEPGILELHHIKLMRNEAANVKIGARKVRSLPWGLQAECSVPY